MGATDVGGMGARNYPPRMPKRTPELGKSMPQILVVLLLVVSCLQSSATTLARPTVHVIATGGTISNVADRFELTGEDLVRGLPQLDQVATVTYEQFSNICSCDMDPGRWKSLALRIDEVFDRRPEVEGIVVTHGTDTLEETAYFLHLTVRSQNPVVLTGAMRAADDLGADGPANLYNAVRVAASDQAKKLGALVLMNDEIHSAREVTKGDAQRPDAFMTPRIGALGFVDPDRVVLLRRPLDQVDDRTSFDLDVAVPLPRVDVVYTYAGADGAAIRSLVDAGARGLVVATFPLGSATPGILAAIREAVAGGVAVVLSGRTGSGRVRPGLGLDEVNRLAAGAPSAGVWTAEDLPPHKARILLMLGLSKRLERSQIGELFRRY